MNILYFMKYSEGISIFFKQLIEKVLYNRILKQNTELETQILVINHTFKKEILKRKDKYKFKKKKYCFLIPFNFTSNDNNLNKVTIFKSYLKEISKIA